MSDDEAEKREEADGPDDFDHDVWRGVWHATGGGPQVTGRPFETLDVSSLPTLPPMTTEMPMVAEEPLAEEIPDITKCPIRNYTTFKLKWGSVDPIDVTGAVQKVLLEKNVKCETLRGGLKLRGSVVPKSDEGTETTVGYEALGSVSFVFQLFRSGENLIGVFRRLCGDVVAYNDNYRSYMAELLQNQVIAPHIEKKKK